MKPFTCSVFGLLLAASGSGLTQARPQFSSGAGGESGLVANIISQLTPFVQSTVAEALAARQSSSSVSTSISSSSGSSFGASSSGSSFGSISGGSSSSGSVSAETRRQLDGQDMFDANPKYTYAYQVANDEKQTYIAQEESRDGDQVNGQYSYVDANGALVTVKYTANDSDGYSETREIQENFVQIKSLPVTKTVETNSVALRPAPRPAAPRPAAGNSDLVARIISQLTPYIKTTVTETLSSRQSAPAVAVQTYEAVPAVSYSSSGSSISSGSSSVESTFGVSGTNNIQVDTPTYQFATEF